VTHEADLILTLVGGLTAALVLGFATQKAKLSPIVGYLIAGVVVGPFTPGFVAHAGIASQFAELGVILLMFGVGLHFHVEDLVSVRRAVIPGALVQVGVSVALGVVVGRAVGWGGFAGGVLGAAISTASTVVVLRVLADANVVQKPEGHVVIGWLLVQDVATVLVLVLVPVLAPLAGGGEVSAKTVALSAALSVGKLLGLVAFTAVVGRRLIPRVLGYVAKTRSRELFTLTVLVVALGIAVGSSLLFGASMALGAFLAGVVVGQSDFAARAGAEALPLRDAFAVLFFVSVGMMLDPRAIRPNLVPILGVAVIVLLANPLVAFLAVKARGYPVRTALTLGLSLGQIGEFSFLLASAARKLEVLPESALPCLVAVSIVSITLNPLVFRLVGPLSRMLAPKASPPSVAPPPIAPGEETHRALVVGYGPVGRTLVKLLREQGITPVVIELNHETVAELRRAGVDAVYGDASQREVLEHARIGKAASLVFTSSAPPDDVLREAKAANPELRILTRATYLREVPGLLAIGARRVITAEAEVALAMAETLLVRLGATPEQIDKTREKLRGDLDGEIPAQS
jgi:CPA2 family monovalent cation:H+ antiporter-2